MDQARELYGNLILVFLGFVSPIVGALMTYFEDGLNLLRIQYENEKTQAEKNISEQMPNITNELGINSKIEKEIINNIKALKKNERIAKQKLKLLNPEKQLLYLFGSVTISLLLLMSSSIVRDIETLKTFTIYGIKIDQILIGLSVVVFIIFIRKMWDLFKVLIDLIKNNNSQAKEKYQTILGILNKMPKDPMVKEVYLWINDKKISDNNRKFEYKVQEKIEIPISVQNSENRMAKNIEVGIMLPLDFLIEKKSSYTVYTSKESQIVRYNQEIIHGSENLIFSKLEVTPLKKEKYTIKVFIKGENMEVKKNFVEFKII